MSKLYPASFYALICSLSVFPISVSAALEPTVMDEVVVTAGRIVETTKEVSSNITIIGREEITRSPSTNLGDLLAERGLAHVQKYPGNLTSIGLRGFRTDSHGNDLQGHVLILLDGRRAGTGNAVKMMTKNIERVEIIRGPGAVQYGSAGMGGVINVITRRGATNSAFVEAGGGSFSRVEGAAGTTAKNGNFDFSGAVISGSADDFTTGNGDTFHNTGYDNETGISLNSGYTFADNHRIGLILTGYRVSDAGSPGYFSNTDLDDSTDKDNFSADIQYAGSSSDNGMQWFARYFGGRDSNTWKYPTASNPTFYDRNVNSSNETQQHGAQAQFSTRIGAYTFTSGIDFINYSVENSWYPEKTEYTNPALFGLGKAKFLEDKFVVTGGLRYDWFRVKVTEPAGDPEENDHITPQIGLVYNPAEFLKLRVQYGQGFMVPSADQLAIDAVHNGIRTVGNSELDPEKSTTYEGGADIHYNSLKLSLGYFATSYEDKIVTTYLADGSRSWLNLGEASIKGIETEMSYDLGELLELAWEIRPYFGATLLTDYTDEETGEDLLYTSKSSLSGGLVVDNGQGIMCRFNVASYSSQDVQDWESGSYPAEVVKLDGFTVADLTASYRFLETERWGSYTVRGEVSNLFDEAYAFVKGYPMPGRAFFVSLRWEY